MPVPSTHVDTFARDRLPAADAMPRLEFTIDDVRYPERVNAASALITESAARFGERPCLLAPGGERWTYAETLAAANRVANVLAGELGVLPGNRVMLRGPNTPWLVVCWLGVLKAGAVAVTTMPVLRAPEVATLIERTRPAVLLCDDRHLDVAASVPDDVTTVAYGADGTGELAARCAAASTEFEDVATAADDIALIGPTSGSTGEPKLTVHYHRDLLANADTFAKHLLAPTPEDVFAGSPPIAFTFGLGGLVVFPLRFGAATLLTERTTPAQLADLVAAHGVTLLFTAPTAYRAILREGRADAVRGLRFGVSAGEHLAGELTQEYRERLGVRLLDGIGSTELLHIFIAAGPGTPDGSTGTPVPGYRAKVVDDVGVEVPAGEAGNLAVIGPTGCRYLDDERQARYVRDGWNVTGDRFRRDADGCFWYESRTDDLIVTSGFNVGAPEVEAALARHPRVLECAVAGKPDPERGQIIFAAVVLDAGSGPLGGDLRDALAAELIAFAKTEIAPYKAPREIAFVDALPRNPSGKLQRFRILDSARLQVAS